MGGRAAGAHGRRIPTARTRRRDTLMARVLFVDDAAFMRKMLGDALSKGGDEVVGEAGNGVEAVDRFRDLKSDVTTIDITMLEKDGLAALKEILTHDPAAG